MSRRGTLSAEAREAVRAFYAIGYTVMSIAVAFGCSVSTVERHAADLPRRRDLGSPTLTPDLLDWEVA